MQWNLRRNGCISDFFFFIVPKLWLSKVKTHWAETTKYSGESLSQNVRFFLSKRFEPQSDSRDGQVILTDLARAADFWVWICSGECSRTRCRPKEGCCSLSSHRTSKKRTRNDDPRVCGVTALTHRHASLSDRSILLRSDHTCYLGLNALACCDVNLTNHAEQKIAIATANNRFSVRQEAKDANIWTKRRGGDGAGVNR